MSNNLQTNTTSALYNAIIEASGKDRPSMLAPGNYNELYEYQWITTHATLGDTDNPPTRDSRVKETYATVPDEIRKKIDVEAKDVHIILNGINNDIYSTVDACPNANEMWKAIERLKQGENINKQDVETNLYWEFRKFTFKDGESLESYYSRFYKMMNELVQNQCIIDNHHVNVQLLLQLKPEWQRFVMIVKQSKDLKNVSYHKLFDILKHHQNEVNEIRAERQVRNANPLALVAATQQPS
ncbi:hypothetical protein Tco_1505612 [Tanacetum coccineum]